MFNDTVFVIQSIPADKTIPAMYWSVFETTLGDYGAWSFDVQNAKQYQTVAAAWEFASTNDGLNLTDDQFHILPYIH
jgi:hypothetical protein